MLSTAAQLPLLKTIQKRGQQSSTTKQQTVARDVCK
jgi:hypothetical protein